MERPKELVFRNNRGGVTLSYPNYLNFRDRARTLSGLIGYRIQAVGLSQGTQNAYIWRYEAAGDYFYVPGVRPIIGRALIPDGDARARR